MSGYALSDLALDDLAEIRHYIAADNPTAAARVVTGFFRRFALISEQPEIGAARPEFAGGDMRIHSVGSYAIVYRIAGSDVEIARVLHSARDLDSLLR